MSQLKLAQQKFVDSKEAVKKLCDKKGRAVNVCPAHYLILYSFHVKLMQSHMQNQVN